MSVTGLFGGCRLRGSHCGVSGGWDGSGLVGVSHWEPAAIAGSSQSKSCRMKFIFVI